MSFLRRKSFAKTRNVEIIQQEKVKPTNTSTQKTIIELQKYQFFILIIMFSH